ncbi:MAG: SufD family Fe-S cluster assembly protein [Brevinematia bacterium]
MKFTNFVNTTDLLISNFELAKTEINSYNNFKFPIIDKTNPKYNIDFSDKFPQDDKLYSFKIDFKILIDDVINLNVDIGDRKVYVEVGRNIVDKGFFVKDLYLSLLGNDKFVKEHFLKNLLGNETIFISYGIAFLKFGIFVYIPDNVRVDLLVNKNFKSYGFGSFYNMFYIGKNTEVKFYEDVSSYDSNFGFEIAEIVVSEDSNLIYNLLNKTDYDFNYFASRKLVSSGDNRIEFNNVSLGSSYQRSDDRIFLYGNNVDLKYTGIYYTNASQRYDLIVNARHLSFNQGADVIVKGVLDDSSKVYFNGILKVDRNLKHINSFLGGHLLHLSPNCKSDSVPSLEIDSFDVKSGHAASLTQLDENKLFYMMSRGLSQEEAREAMVQGFIEGGLNRITDVDFRKKVKNHLRDKGLKVVEEDLFVG